MKPYFAKYLPVEGEIKRGDTVLFPDSWIGKVNEIDDNLIYAYNEGSILNSEKEKFKKVKLFLCSRDVQLGDKFRLINNQSKEFEASRVEMGSGENYFPRKMLVWHKERQVEYWFNLDVCFKVIGEISLEALKERPFIDDIYIRKFYNSKLYVIEDEIEVGDIVDIDPYWSGLKVHSIDRDTIWCFNQGDDDIVPFNIWEAKLLSKAIKE